MAMEKAQAMVLTNVFYIDMDVVNIEEILECLVYGEKRESVLMYTQKMNQQLQIS